MDLWEVLNWEWYDKVCIFKYHPGFSVQKEEQRRKIRSKEAAAMALVRCGWGWPVTSGTRTTLSSKKRHIQGRLWVWSSPDGETASTKILETVKGGDWVEEDRGWLVWGRLWDIPAELSSGWLARLVWRSEERTRLGGNKDSTDVMKQ